MTKIITTPRNSYKTPLTTHGSGGQSPNRFLHAPARMRASALGRFEERIEIKYGMRYTAKRDVVYADFASEKRKQGPNVVEISMIKNT